MTRLREMMAWLRREGAMGHIKETDWFSNPYVHVRLKLADDCGPCPAEANGFAKCKPGDKWDPALGEHIARGRAIRRIAEQLIRAGVMFDQMGNPTLTVIEEDPDDVPF